MILRNRVIGVDGFKPKSSYALYTYSIMKDSKKTIAMNSKHRVIVWYQFVLGVLKQI